MTHTTEMTLARSGVPKILFVESGRGYGGSVFSLQRLVKTLDTGRYQAMVAAFQHTEPLAQVEDLGIPVSILKTVHPFRGRVSNDTALFDRLRNYLAVYGNLGVDAVYNGVHLARHIIRSNIGLVHLNNGIQENLSAFVAARLTNRHCVTHVRGTEPVTKIEKYCAPWVAAIITLNRTVHAEYTGLVGAQRVHVIRNGVDLDAFERADASRVRRELGISGNTFAMGTFARLVEGKGISEFIAAAARVLPDHPDVRCFIVGDDPSPSRAQEDALRRQAASLGVGSRFMFTGWRNDRFDVMAAMDVVVQVSTTFPEGMSLAPLEGMALRKPVIVSDNPGYESAVDPGKTGFIVPRGDVEALAACMARLIRNRDETKRLGAAAYDRAVREFDIRLTAQRVQALYDSILFRNGAQTIPLTTSAPDVDATSTLQRD